MSNYGGNQQPWSLSGFHEQFHEQIPPALTFQSCAQGCPPSEQGSRLPTPILSLLLVPSIGFSHKISFEKGISVALDKVHLFLETYFLFFLTTKVTYNHYRKFRKCKFTEGNKIRITCFLTTY